MPSYPVTDGNVRKAKRLLRRLLAVLTMATATAASAQTPLVIGPTGHPVATVEIDGQEATFVIDTGAEGSAVYEDFARDRSLPTETKKEELHGQTGSAPLPLRRISTLTLDGRRFGPLDAVELPPRPGAVALQGIVGLDTMGSYLVEFDVPAKRLTLLSGKEAAATVLGLGRPIRARRLTGGLLALPVKIGAVAGWAVIDTGARETRINTRFATAAGLRIGKSGNPLKGATQTTLAQRTSIAPTMILPGKRLSGIRLQVVDLPVFEIFGIAHEPAMLLGIDTLRRYRLVLDFPTGRVWLR